MLSQGLEVVGVLAEQVSPAVARLVAAADEVAAQAPDALAGPVALADARVLMAQLDVLRAALLGRLGDVERRGLHVLEDAGTTSAWVQAQPSATGRDEVALARRLTALPHLHQQLRAGVVSLRAGGLVAAALERVERHVDRPDGCIDGHPGEPVLTNVIVDGGLQVLCEAVGGLADDDPVLAALSEQLGAVASAPLGQLARLERAFSLLAARLPGTMLRQGLDRLVDALLPEQLAARDRDGQHRRALALRRNADGSGFTLTRGQLSLECGEHLAAVLAALRTTDPANRGDTAAWRSLRDLLDQRRPRTPDAGTADLSPSTSGPGTAAPTDQALSGDATAPLLPASVPPIDLGEGGDGLQGDGSLPGPEPRSRVQQDHDAFLLALRALLDSGVLGSRAKTAPHVLVTVGLDALHDQPGALPAVSATTGATLPAGLVRRLLCDSRLTRAVLGLGRRVMEVSHTDRTARPHERLALLLRWGGRCAEAGCTSPPGTPLIPHHGTPWASSGTTALDDQVPLCSRTHRTLHEDARTLTLRDGRRVGPQGWVTRTDGRPAGTPDGDEHGTGPPPAA